MSHCVRRCGMLRLSMALTSSKWATPPCGSLVISE
jgi:hypothetical protein